MSGGAFRLEGLEQPRYVPYMDLSGGLNTRKDAHALARNQLANSVNTWGGTGNAISKRPGNVAYASGATGSGTACKGAARGFFGGQTVVLVQCGTTVYEARPTDGSFTAISGSLGSTPGKIRTAQMYSPDSTANLLFLVDGVDTPKTWQGPSTAFGTVHTGTIYCPTNHSNSAPITPKYITTAGFYLIYAGEPTEPSAVYISNPYYPEQFNINSTTAAIVGSSYIPYMVGWNDGVQGGDITGVETLPDGTATGAVMVYKQAAVYRMNQVGFFGEMYWGATVVSASIGCLSPDSIVRFDTFHCFLGIDGVYQTDGNSVRRISDNVPTLFDSTLTGIPAAILNRTTAVACRQGQRYIIFFDDGNGTVTPAGYPTLGAVFDFAKLDEDGLPCVSLIRGMTPAAVVPMLGPLDDGNFVWCDATKDGVSRFGVGSSDLGAAIAVNWSGCADFMIPEFGSEAPLCLKKMDPVSLLLSANALSQSEMLVFTCSIASDYVASSTNQSSPVMGPLNPAIYGTGGSAAIYGQAIYTATSQNTFVVAKVAAQNSAEGHVLQISFSESSVYPWTVLGVLAYVERKAVSQ